MGDTLYTTLAVIAWLSKLQFQLSTILIVAEISGVLGIVLNYSPQYQYLSEKIVGANGHYDTYCLIINLMVTGLIFFS